MINTSGIYFLEDSNDCNYFVKDICKKVKIKLDLEIDFEKLISHVIIHQPEILIFNLKTGSLFLLIHFLLKSIKKMPRGLPMDSSAVTFLHLLY